MNHVVGCGDDAHLFVDGHHQWVVDLQQVIVNVHALGAIVRHFAMLVVERRDESNAFALTLEVVIPPFPLISSGLDGEVGVGGVFLSDHNLGCRQSHQDDDDERNHGPRDFHLD